MKYTGIKERRLVGDSGDDIMAEKDLESPYDDCGRLFRTALFLEYHRFPLVLVSYRVSTVPVSLNDDVTLRLLRPGTVDRQETW